MNRYALTPAAANDLEEIAEYVAAQSPERASRVIERLMSAMQRIAERPNIGHRHDSLADETLRVWNVFLFLIVYRPRLNRSRLCE